MLKRVISGGQTGADKAGLRAARVAGIPTGGTVPRGWRTERGTDLELRAFGVLEHESSDYPPRTRANVENSDGTLIISRLPVRGGSALTASLARRLRKPYLIVSRLNQEESDNVTIFLGGKKIETLNIAGSRESSWPGVEEEAMRWLVSLFRRNLGAQERLD